MTIEEKFSNLVCSKFNISAKALKSRLRDRKYSEPRMIFVYILRKHTVLTSRAIANIIGYKNRSSVPYADAQVSVLLGNNAEFVKKSEEIINEAELIAEEYKLNERVLSGSGDVDIFDFYSPYDVNEIRMAI